MPVATEFRSPVKSSSETRAILGLGGNRVRVFEESKRKKENLKKAEKPKKLVPETTPEKVDRGNDVPADSYCSSDSSCSGSSVKTASSKRKVKKHNVVFKSVNVEAPMPLMKRCDWITPNSEPLYTRFHDEEWGVPVHDDKKLFELLVLSQALAEFTWPAILNKRDTFRKHFENFDPSSVAKFTEKNFVSMRSNGGNPLLSEQKLRAVVENANQLLKVQKEFGSFSNYCWQFVNHNPIRNGFRYARQVPAKTPKSELISKDLMQRGFRCVGPTVVYSFMQVSGMVNDHLLSCPRYHECNNNIAVNTDLNPEFEETKLQAAEAVESQSVSND